MVTSTKRHLATELDDKVDKDSGKGLSTEDFTTELKEKLDSIEGAVFKSDTLSYSGAVPCATTGWTLVAQTSDWTVEVRGNTPFCRLAKRTTGSGITYTGSSSGSSNSTGVGLPVMASSGTLTRSYSIAGTGASNATLEMRTRKAFENFFVVDARLAHT